jgi:hypothetical protein
VAGSVREVAPGQSLGSEAVADCCAWRWSTWAMWARIQTDEEMWARTETKLLRAPEPDGEEEGVTARLGCEKSLPVCP